MKPRHDFENFKYGLDYSTLIHEKINSNGNIVKKCDLTSTEMALIYCYHCRGNQKNAYKCNNNLCPLYPINNMFMRKPHPLSKETEERLRKQMNINRKNKDYGSN